MMVAQAVWLAAFPASLLGSVCLTVIVVMCVCSCRAKEHKDELVGIEGHVKITNPEEFTDDTRENNVSQHTSVSEKPNTAKRSLPDLPIDTANGTREVAWERNGDAGSELYATVGQQESKRSSHLRDKSGSGSMSPGYALVKGEHPYDKLKKVEHPYAQVNTEAACSSRDRQPPDEEEAVMQIRPEVPRRESSGDIQAATAIAGHVTASDDLPYMTPPAHFSGDSHDSGKGYTSISVREPLATIRAETKPTPARIDPPYASVSDDSDDMYAAIDDPMQIYTSESETYAKIQPGRSSVSAVETGAAGAAGGSTTAPQPPSVDSLKQMTVTSQSHSRQASSSSAASSTVVSSPKPDKRPANSPLPPPPTLNVDTAEDLYSSVEKTKPTPCNIEDMYAKVNKKTRKELEPKFERRGSTESAISESSDSVSYKAQTSHTTTESTSRSTHSCYGKSTTTESSSPSSSVRRDVTDSISSEGEPLSDVVNCYERLEGEAGGYETVKKDGAVSDSEPNYELVQEHDYASIARIKRHRKAERTDSDGYAKINPHPNDNEIYAKIENASDGYAKVMKFNNNSEDPNYEQVFHGSLAIQDEAPEPTYESLGVGFESDDQNYESVRFVQTTAHIEPPYQLLTDCETGATSK